MTDAKTLARKLAALTATETFQGKAMILCKSGQPAAMSYVLQAIDGTMLLRDVVFSVADQSLTLRISGKRVIGVLAASGDLQVPASALGQPLAADDTATLDLLGLCGTCNRHVRIERRRGRDRGGANRFGGSAASCAGERLDPV